MIDPISESERNECISAYFCLMVILLLIFNIAIPSSIPLNIGGSQLYNIGDGTGTETVRGKTGPKNSQGL
jgi:hypothetical protein